MIYLCAGIAVASLSLNVFLVLYIRENLRFLHSLRASLLTTFQEVTKFVEHLDNVYSLDTFYGDSTLEGLLKHVGDLSEDLQQRQKQIDEYFNG